MRQLAKQAAVILACGFAAGAAGWAQQSGASPLVEEIRARDYTLMRTPEQASGIDWFKLAVLYQDAARYGDAERGYRKAIALLKGGNRAVLSAALDHLGTTYVECGKYAKAEPLEQRALAMREADRDLAGIGTSYMHLALLSYGKKDMAAAEADAEMAVSLLVPAHNEHTENSNATPVEKMAALIDLSLVQCARGSCADAIPNLNRALDLAHSYYAANSIPVGMADFLLGYAHWKSDDSHVAEEKMKTGVAELASQLGWGHPTYIAALWQYKALLTQNGEVDEAAEVGVRIAKLDRSHEAIPPAREQALFGLDRLR